VSIYTQIARFCAGRQRFQPDTGPSWVRRLPLGMTLSVAFHLALVAWVATRSDRAVLPAPHSAGATIVEILPPSTPEPVAIALLDEATTREIEARSAQPSRANATPPTRGRDRTQHANPSATESISTGTPHPVETPGRAPESGSGSSLMKMRGTDIASGPSQQFVDEFLEHSKPLEKEPEPTGQLHASGNGRYKTHESGYEMTVERDGTAHFKDADNFHVGIALPSPKAIGKGLGRWAEDPYGAGGEAGKSQVRGEYHSLGADDKPESSNVIPIPVISGGFDATDWMMRRHGQDPYASKKLKALDSTRDERVQIGKQRRAQMLARSTELMQQNLDRVRGSAVDPHARKQALFELWDECAETGDTALVEGGHAARMLVVGFIRANFPSGTSDAYTPAELARLNGHRQSAATFAPYD
jgi:hypothetical protein